MVDMWNAAVDPLNNDEEEFEISSKYFASKNSCLWFVFFFSNSQLIFFETSCVHVTIFVPSISYQAMETA